LKYESTITLIIFTLLDVYYSVFLQFSFNSLPTVCIHIVLYVKGMLIIGDSSSVGYICQVTLRVFSVCVIVGFIATHLFHMFFII